MSERYYVQASGFVYDREKDGELQNGFTPVGCAGLLNSQDAEIKRLTTWIPIEEFKAGDGDTYCLLLDNVGNRHPAHYSAYLEQWYYQTGIRHMEMDSIVAFASAPNNRTFKPVEKRATEEELRFALREVTELIGDLDDDGHAVLRNAKELLDRK